jgi:cellulose synthase/poly-beta-1,6-N-acetylglucosamine synthase-like glycosyltransferase
VISLLLISISYISIIVRYTIGWNKLKTNNFQNNNPSFNSFSIIIAFRNEAPNLSKLLNSLKQINYPKTLYEVILINDDSTDKSKLIVEDFIVEHNLNWNLLHSSKGKKDAIKKGINNSSLEYIFTTDADCIIPKNILKTYDQVLQLKKWKLISGPVDFYSNNSFLGKIFEMEFMSLVSSGAGAIGINKPIMLNAANLIFQRKIALEANNTIYDSNIASGDDIFLLHYIMKHYDNKEITFLKNKDAIIQTKAPKTLKQWLSQRLRWASKAKYYKINNTSISALIIMLFNIALLFTFALLLFKSYWLLYINLLIIKLIVDYPILHTASKFFNKKISFSAFIIIELLYPFYIVGIGILGLFIKSKWKGRKI